MIEPYVALDEIKLVVRSVRRVGTSFPSEKTSPAASLELELSVQTTQVGEMPSTSPADRDVFTGGSRRSFAGGSRRELHRHVYEDRDYKLYEDLWWVRPKQSFVVGEESYDL
ncbi:hypothetical protein YC2023_026024 [Brassica napus]